MSASAFRDGASVGGGPAGGCITRKNNPGGGLNHDGGGAAAATPAPKATAFLPLPGSEMWLVQLLLVELLEPHGRRATRLGALVGPTASPSAGTRLSIASIATTSFSCNAAASFSCSAAGASWSATLLASVLPSATNSPSFSTLHSRSAPWVVAQVLLAIAQDPAHNRKTGSSSAGKLQGGLDHHLRDRGRCDERLCRTALMGGSAQPNGHGSGTRAARVVREDMRWGYRPLWPALLFLFPSCRRGLRPKRLKYPKHAINAPLAAVARSCLLFWASWVPAESPYTCCKRAGPCARREWCEHELGA